jgi:hypothetical protein
MLELCLAFLFMRQREPIYLGTLTIIPIVGKGKDLGRLKINKCYADEIE